MHRSGTSLFAKYFSQCGVHMGDEVLAPKPDNPEGFFEDVGFVSLHEAMLDENGTTWSLPGNPEPLTVGDPIRKKALEMADARRARPLWGWKDPRTVLFLDFWAEALPEAVFVFVYRDPAKVVQSLYERGDLTACIRGPHRFLNGALYDLKVPRYLNATRIWVAYNRRILEFMKSNRDRSLLFNLEECLSGNASVSALVSKAFKIEGLNGAPIGTVFNQGIMSSSAPALPRLVRKMSTSCRTVLEDLHAMRTRP